MTTQPLKHFEPLRPRQLIHEAVQDAIKNYIAENGLRVGDALPPEGELARQLGVSRTSVREATKALDVLGVIEVRLGSGLYVRAFTFDPIVENLPYAIQPDLRGLADLVEIRFNLEYGMAPRVIASATDQQITELKAILRQMQDDAARGVYSPHVDRQFHDRLYVEAGNLLLGRFLGVFWEVSHRLREGSVLPPPRSPEDTYARHVPIVESLSARNLERYAVSVIGHYTGIEERLRSAGIEVAGRLGFGGYR